MRYIPKLHEKYYYIEYKSLFELEIKVGHNINDVMSKFRIDCGNCFEYSEQGKEQIKNFIDIISVNVKNLLKRYIIIPTESDTESRKQQLLTYYQYINSIH